jgi:hypothetical protein
MKKKPIANYLFTLALWVNENEGKKVEFTDEFFDSLALLINKILLRHGSKS